MDILEAVWQISPYNNVANPIAYNVTNSNWKIKLLTWK